MKFLLDTNFIFEICKRNWTRNPPPPAFAATSDLIHFERTDRHDGRDRVLVDKLRKTVPDKGHGKAVERGDDALKLHAIYQEYRQWHLFLAQLRKEGVL